MKKIKIGIMMLLFTLFSTFAYAFKLDSIDYNQRMDKDGGGYKEFKITNNSTAKQRYKIEVLKGIENDGSKFVEVFPKVITIEPKSSSRFKVFSNAPATAEKGLYDFQLNFKPVVIPTLTKGKEGVISGQSSINLAPVVQMYGYVGEINFQEALSFEDIVIEKNSNGEGIVLKGKLFNNSYAFIEMGIELFGAGDTLLTGKYLTTMGENRKGKEIVEVFEKIKNPKDVKKIVFYRTIADEFETLKVVELDNE